MKRVQLLLAAAATVSWWAAPAQRAPTSDSLHAYERFAVDGDQAALSELIDRAERGRLDALGWQRLGLALLGVGLSEPAVAAFTTSIELENSLTRSWAGLHAALGDERRAERDAMWNRWSELSGPTVCAAACGAALAEADMEQLLHHARRGLVDCAGQIQEVALLTYEVLALARLDRRAEFDVAWRRLRYEMRATPGLVPALHAADWAAVERIQLEVLGLRADTEWLAASRAERVEHLIAPLEPRPAESGR